MPPKVCECGAGPGHGHRVGCYWYDADRPDPMTIKCPHPGCGAGVGKACHGRETSGVHVRRRISVDPEHPLIAIGVVLAKIKSRGRAGDHADADDACGCGRCCAMLVRALEAACEGSLVKFQAPEK